MVARKRGRAHGRGGGRGASRAEVDDGGHRERPVGGGMDALRIDDRVALEEGEGAGRVAGGGLPQLPCPAAEAAVTIRNRLGQALTLVTLKSC